MVLTGGPGAGKTAILELIRHRGLGLEQPEPEGDIFLVTVSDTAGIL